MPLITTIDDVRSNGVGLMFFSDENAIADMTAAEEYFLVPILGRTLYDILLAEISETDSDYVTLIAKARRALAPLAYWLDLPNIQSRITDRGTGSFSSDNMQPLRQWEYDELRESLAAKGCFAMEKMLEHLYDQKSFYSWTVPDAYKSIFLTGIDFSTVFPVFEPYRTFESLRPLVKQVENQYIRPSIGSAFFDYLRDKTSPTAEEAEAIRLMRIAVANFTIKTAAEILPVKISTNGFTVILKDAKDKKFQGQAQAPNTQMSMLYDSVKNSGETAHMQLKEYLNKTAGAGVLAMYFNSTYYSAPVNPADIIDPNEGSLVFGL